MRVKVRSDFRRLATDGREHQGLAPQAEFYVIEVNQDSYRVIDCDGEPILYPKQLFEIIDASIPSGWQFREYEDGEYFLEPASTAKPGFYEEWHGSDGDRAAQEAARQTLRDELLRTAAKAGAADKTLIHEALSRLPPGTEPPSNH